MLGQINLGFRSKLIIVYRFIPVHITAFFYLVLPFSIIFHYLIHQNYNFKKRLQLIPSHEPITAFID